MHAHLVQDRDRAPAPPALAPPAVTACRRPDLAAVRVHAGHTHGRLHRHVREVRDVVLRDDSRSRSGQRGVHLPHVAHAFPRRANGGEELVPVGGRVVRSVRPRVPGHLERRAPAHRRPGRVGENGDAPERLKLVRRRRRRELDHALHAGHLPRPRRVERSHLAAHHRRPGDHRREHPRQTHVGPVDRGPGHDRRRVDVRQRLAGAAEIARRAERDLGRIGEREARGLPRQLAEAETPLARRVRDLVIVRLALRSRHPPPPGRRRHQHHPRGGTEAAERFVGVAADAGRAVGVLVAVGGVPVGLGDVHAREVGPELVGHQRRKGAAHPLPHLRSRAGDRDQAVGRHVHERVGGEPGVPRHLRHGRPAPRARLGLLPLRLREGRGDPERQGPGREPERHEERAPRNEDLAHDQPPSIPAALRTAERIRV